MSDEDTERRRTADATITNEIMQRFDHRMQLIVDRGVRSYEWTDEARAFARLLRQHDERDQPHADVLTSKERAALLAVKVAFDSGRRRQMFCDLSVLREAEPLVLAALQAPDEPADGAVEAAAARVKTELALAGDGPESDPTFVTDLRTLIAYARATVSPSDGLDYQRARIIAGQTNLADVIMGLEDLLLRAGREIRQHFPQGTRLIEEIEIKLGRIGCTKEV